MKDNYWRTNILDSDFFFFFCLSVLMCELYFLPCTKKFPPFIASEEGSPSTFKSAKVFGTNSIFGRLAASSFLETIIFIESHQTFINHFIHVETIEKAKKNDLLLKKGFRQHFEDLNALLMILEKTLTKCCHLRNLFDLIIK